jgi:hypothetical protein
MKFLVAWSKYFIAFGIIGGLIHGTKLLYLRIYTFNPYLALFLLLALFAWAGAGLEIHVANKKKRVGDAIRERMHKNEFI